MEDWWSSVTTSAMSVTESALKMADDIGDAVATQIKQYEDEIVAEQKSVAQSSSSSSSSAMDRSSPFLVSCNPLRDKDGSLLMPWETNCEVNSILSQDLMEQILALSQHEANFTKPPASDLLASNPAIEFDFQACIPIIMRMLEVDLNLSRLHAKLIPTMKFEETFWLNYFLRILYLRCCIGIDRVEDDESYNQLYLLDDSTLSEDEVRNWNRDKVRVSEAIQLKGQIGKLKPNEVLFVDPAPPSISAVLAATGTVPGAGAGAGADSVASTPDSSTTTTSVPSKAAVPVPLTPAHNTAQVASAPAARPVTLPGLITKQTQHIKKQLTDQELDAEIEAELNEEFEPSKPIAKAVPVPKKEISAPAPKTVNVPASIAAVPTTTKSDSNSDAELDLELDDLDLELEGLDVADDDLDLEDLGDLDDLDVDEDECVGADAGSSAHGHVVSSTSNSSVHTSIEMVASAEDISREMNNH